MIGVDQNAYKAFQRYCQRFEISEELGFENLLIAQLVMSGMDADFSNKFQKATGIFLNKFNFEVNQMILPRYDKKLTIELPDKACKVLNSISAEELGFENLFIDQLVMSGMDADFSNTFPKAKGIFLKKFNF